MSEVSRFVAAGVALPFLVGLGVAGSSEDSPERDVVATFADPEITESSGLVASADRLVTVNDSGDEGRTFVVDAATGRTVGHATWGEASDVEALAPIDGDLLVADIGDNDRQRDTISILRVPWPTSGDVAVDPAGRVELVYPDGAHDAESLLVDPVSERVLIATKDVLGGELYEVPSYAVPPRVGAPAPVEPVRLTPVGDVLGFATDGAFFPDGRHLVLRGYGDATVYTWPDLQVAGTVELPRQEQGEGIAVREVDGAFEVLVSSEGQRSDVLRVSLPQSLAEAVAPVSADVPGRDHTEPHRHPRRRAHRDRPRRPAPVAGSVDPRGRVRRRHAGPAGPLPAPPLTRRGASKCEPRCQRMRAEVPADASRGAASGSSARVIRSLQPAGYRRTRHAPSTPYLARPARLDPPPGRLGVHLPGRPGPAARGAGGGPDQGARHPARVA